MTVSQKIALLLLETKAVKLNPAQPFTWSSGWNSPIYCDNRVTLSFVEGRTFIKKSLAKAIK
jgi:orotate phosphoribosyltransferase